MYCLRAQPQAIHSPGAPFHPKFTGRNKAHTSGEGVAVVLNQLPRSSMVIRPTSSTLSQMSLKAALRSRLARRTGIQGQRACHQRTSLATSPWRGCSAGW